MEGRMDSNFVEDSILFDKRMSVERFLLDAPDDHWLLAKIVTIFGIFGCCRCDELLTLTMKDVENMGKYIGNCNIATIKKKKKKIYHNR
ncbi:hypothetical protein NQ317_005531 [Molorchus minor]|uniref:Uncharacterized protein n=1 Tax=Molorchus minor TaxID=1323400 RepID=A0ABQ9J021_9CUCU|nr:hypothetical protein NQ317_005531 [Molorchus minor]